MTPQRPDVESQLQSRGLSPDWIVGFVDGEGCFHVGISRQPKMSLGCQVLPELTVVQHRRDIALLHRLRSAMGCGVVRRNHDDRYCWRVRELTSLARVVVPFFERHPLRSRKAVEFRKFARVVRLMVQQAHLTEEGLSRIRRIAATMNRGSREP